MPRLTSAQLTTLKNHLAANAATVNVGGTDFAINFITANPGEQSTEASQKVAAWYNAEASPAYWCWRTSVEKKEIVEKVSQDGTSFVWAGNGFISRSVGELECWKQLFNTVLTCNPSLTNVRQAFQDIFSGAGNAALNRTHLLATTRHKALIGQKLFAVAATGPGNSGIALDRGLVTNPDAPGTGTDDKPVISLTPQDVKDAWAS